jgi:hypothetical protein
MLGAMRESFPMFRRYFQARPAAWVTRTRCRGGIFLRQWRAGEQSRTTWPETADFIVTQFGTFSTDWRIWKRAFTNAGSMPNRATENAAPVCMRIPALKESRVLCNFDGSLDKCPP